MNMTHVFTVVNRIENGNADKKLEAFYILCIVFLKLSHCVSFLPL